MNKSSKSEEILLFVEPAMKYRETALSYVNEFIDEGVDINGINDYVGMDSHISDTYDSYAKWLIWLYGGDTDEKSTDSGISSFTFFYIRESDNTLVGTVNIRQNAETDLEKISAMLDAGDTYSGNIGYSIRPSLQGKGYGSEELSTLISFCSFLGMERLIAAVAEENLGSIRILEKNGFKVFKTTYDRRKNFMIRYYTLDI